MRSAWAFSMAFFGVLISAQSEASSGQSVMSREKSTLVLHEEFIGDGTRRIQMREISSKKLIDEVFLRHDAEEYVILEGCEVEKEGQKVSAALVDYEDLRELLNNVHMAWIFDSSISRFVAINPAGVVCRNESFGE